ncbi:EamA/RhaT family transporter [Raoultella planticola]|uniref:DMT family transporter n=1 Tax=Raoultella planticola TaxID=575 RepID=UPI000537FA50|nr:DMT family transporter [Raoultella planticola]AUU06109.1 EamA/RhaT family transporter [Raoultella planticola]PNK81045.1 EamA/RhaT family transporter [Raoultella planticola]
MDLRKFQALAGVQLCTMLFCLSAVLAKGLPLPVSAIVAGRAAWAVVTLSAVLLLARRQWRRLSWRELSQLSINGLLLAGHWICFFTGVEQGGVAVGTLGFACFPLFVALIGRVIFATPITRRDVAAMVMVAVGLVVISPEALSAQGGGTALLWALAAGLSYAVIVLYNRHAKTGASPLQSAWLQCCACALATLPWGYSAIRSADGETLLHVILIGVLCTGIAYSLLTFALQYVAAGKAAIVIALEPLWAVFFAAIWFGSLPGPAVFIGGGLIIAAVAFCGSPS